MAPTLSKPCVAGDVIATSARPLVHIVCSEFMSQFCSNCLKRAHVLQKCSKCHEISYCGKSCQTSDWKYHKIECKVLRRKDFVIDVMPGVERLLLRLWLYMRSDETFATKRHQLFDGSDVCLNDIEVDVIKVVESNSFVVDERFHDFDISCNHFRALGLDFDRKELFHWFAFIVNSMNICTQSMPYISGDSPNIYPGVGIGLFIEYSSLSHSCQPNCAIVTTGYTKR